VNAQARPAFYALAPGGWRDYVTVLHPPYTLWHLSYVAIGAALAPDLHVERLLQTLAAFFLALGIGAHALDELRGRPLGTRISATTLVALAVASIAGAVAIGVVVAAQVDPWLLVFVAVGAFFVVAYNLELWHGRFHGDWWFAIGWGAFPLVTAYYAQAQRLGAEAVAGAAFAVLTSLAQRHLSTQVRTIRRKAVRVSGEIVGIDGGVLPIDETTLTRAPEQALRALIGAVVALAVALVLLHVT
jgi:hypothetical protein